MSESEQQEVFEEYVRGKDREMWGKFLREPNGKCAKCKICDSIIKTSGGNTSGLRRHLSLVHKIQAKPAGDADASAPKKACTPSVGSFFPVVAAKDDKSLPHIVARMTALDGLPFRVFATSADIRAGLIARGFPALPVTPNPFRQMVMTVHTNVQKSVAAHFQMLKVMCGIKNRMQLRAYNLSIYIYMLSYCSRKATDSL